MTGDRAQTLRWLERRGGVITAIKCLDEGVDIPSVTHALILASSKNPREFVQRWGRVLRRAPGKALAYVHDAIVLPPALDTADEVDPESRRDAVTAGELRGRLSAPRMRTIRPLLRICSRSRSPPDWIGDGLLAYGQ